MVKRVCGTCFTRWYSADTSQKIWTCTVCGAEIPGDKTEEAEEGKDENKGFRQ